MKHKKLKIAEVVPLMVEVPPKKYGGIENIVTDLTLGMAKLGHEVTVFAAGKSTIKGKNIKLVPCSPRPTTEDLSKNREYEIAQLEKIIKMQDEFDLIHFHYEPAIGRVIKDGKEINLFSEIKVPKIYTFHNTTYIDENIEYYRANQDILDGEFVFISKDHQAPLSFLKNSTVIYNGIHLEQYTFNNNPEDYLLFAGRITRVKGILEAIKVAKAAKKKLVIFGKVDSTDKDFYERDVKLHIDGKQIVYLGEQESREKVRYYRNAKCLLFPISWHEPFGLVMIESMSCGTPVIAFNIGSVNEIVKDKISGFVVNNVNDMVKRVKEINTIDRGKCRERVEKNFTSEEMIKNYAVLYQKVAS